MSFNDKWKEILDKYNIRNEHADEVNYSIVDWIAELEHRVNRLQDENLCLKEEVKLLHERLDRRDEPLL